jgi:cation diffusion facilitator CzcD-associated flavoprotein CzcO
MIDEQHIVVAIVGAGFAGIGAAIRLAREGRHSFVLLERSDRVGGTWRDNTYPGAACDIPSHLYSFSFLPNPDWSGTFAAGDEIQAYLEGAVAGEGLATHTRLGTDVTDATWDEASGCWRLTLSSASGISTMTADAVLLACGRLSEPELPDVDGIETFRGAHFHSARWDHSVPLDGARVAIVGTGASAVQLLPHVAERAGSVTLFQRSAAWVLPRDERPYTAAERGLFAKDPGEIARLRSDLFWRGEELFASRSGDDTARAALQSRALAHLEAQVADPELRAVLTPDYEIGCKRAVFSSTYFPALTRQNVTVEPSALGRIEGSVLTAASGRTVEADVVIFATGFASTRQPYAERIHGAGGESLAEHWGAGMTSFASTLVHGFPNLFVVNGPNGGLGHNSAVYMIEAQIDFILDILGGSASALVAADAETAYTAELDAASAETVWLQGGCRSWYVDDRSDRLTLLWPGFAHEFRARLQRATRELTPTLQRDRTPI